MNSSYAASADRAQSLADLKVNLVTPELENFRIALESKCTEYVQKSFPITATLSEIRIELETGPKFVRVVRAEYTRGDKPVRIAASAHCFIDRTNGNILKAAGWSAPDKKNPRGNIFAADPLAGVTVYGVVYLR